MYSGEYKVNTTCTRTPVVARVLRWWHVYSGGMCPIPIDYHDLRCWHNITMGRLKQKRPSGHSFVEFVETESRRGPVMRERVIPSSPLKRRASTSPSKTRYPTPNTGDYPSTQDDDPQNPKRIRVGQKVSTLYQPQNHVNTQHLEPK